MSAGQSVTNFSCRTPWLIAGAGKLAPAANDPTPASTSRRLMATLSPRDHLALRPARALSARISLGLRPWLLQFATRSKQPLLLDLLRQRGEQRSSILPHHSNEGSIVHHGRI